MPLKTMPTRRRPTTKTPAGGSAKPLVRNDQRVTVVTIPQDLSELYAINDQNLDDTLAELIWPDVTMASFRNACRGSGADYRTEEVYLFDASVSTEAVADWVLNHPTVAAFMRRHDL
jgi:hypothetical protein